MPYKIIKPDATRLSATNIGATAFSTIGTSAAAFAFLALLLLTTINAQAAAQPLSVTQAPVGGFNVVQVDVATGYFAYSPNDSAWFEFDNNDEAQFRFEQTARDENSVYLYDASRDVKLRLDLFLNQVLYAAGNAPMVPIYEITNHFGPAPAIEQQAVLPEPALEAVLTVQNYSEQPINIFVDGPEGPVFVRALGALEELVQPAQSEQVWRWAQNDEWLGGITLQGGPVTVRVPE